jgi:hypothetical protein
MNNKLLACIGLLAVSLTACSDKSKNEAAAAGDHAAAAAQDAGAATVTAAEDVGNAASDAATNAGTAVDNAAEKTAEAARNAAADAKEAAAAYANRLIDFLNENSADYPEWGASCHKPNVKGSIKISAVGDSKDYNEAVKDEVNRQSLYGNNGNRIY